MKFGLQIVRFDWPGSPANIGPALAQIGIQTFIFSIANVQDLSAIETIGREVIPAVADF